MNNTKASRYDAFISYRHSEIDRQVAEKLHRMLETFRVPKAVVKKGSPKKIGRVFRDRDELPTSSNLADNIQYALENSGYLIVICSPRTPQSQWVMKEIETFGALHGRDRILALLIEGEPHESFPEPLRMARVETCNPDGTVSSNMVEIEPLAADIRDKSIKGMLKKLRVEILRLLAPMLGCGYDDLKQRHRERTIKRILTISISLSLFFLCFGSFAAYQAFIINQQSALVLKQSEIVEEQARKVQQQADELGIQVQKTLAGQSLYLSDVSSRLLAEGDRRTAILVALEALPKNPEEPERPYVEEAEFALSEALRVYKHGFQYVPDMALKHDMPVNFIRISEDAKTAVTSAKDGYVYIWDTEYGRLKNKYFMSERFPEKSDLVFRDNSSIILDNGAKVTCLDINTLEPLWEHQEYVYSFTMNRDGTLLAVVAETIEILDPATGESIYGFSVEEYMEDSEDSFTHVSYSGFDESGRYLCLGISNGNALVFDTAERMLHSPFKARGKYIMDIDLSSDGNVAVASSPLKLELFPKDNGFIDIFGLSSGDKHLEMTFDAITDDLAFHPDDSNMLLFTEYDRINALNVESRELEYTFALDGEVSDYYISGNYIFSSSLDGTIRALRMLEGGYENGNFRITMHEGIDSFEPGLGVFAISLRNSDNAYILRDLQNKETIDLGRFSSIVEGVCFSTDGSRMITSEFSPGEVIEWDMIKNEKLGTLFSLDDGYLRTIRFSDGDTKIFVLPPEGTISVYHADTLELLETRDTEYISDYCMSPDGSLCALATSDGIDVVSASDLSLIAAFPGFHSVCELAIYDDNSKLIVSDGFSKATVYDIESGSPIHEFLEEGISSIAVSHDSNTLAFACGGDAVRFYDASTFEEKGTIDGLHLDVQKLVFDPSDSSLFIGLDDCSIKRYDVETGKLLCDLEGHTAELADITFSKDNSLFLTRDGSNDGIVWKSDTNKKLGMIPNIDGIHPDFKYFVCGKDSYNEAIVPYYDLKMLVEEAERQLGGVTLTDGEKVRLFITE